MSLLSSIFLGVLQGLTEFLPVSSSGHLVIAQNLIINFKQPGMLFDVFLHAGTLLAIIFYYRKKIFSMSLKFFSLIIIGTIPAIVAGFMFQSLIENLFLSSRVVGFALLITGLFNYLTDKVKPQGKIINTKAAFLIGLVQALAVIPGISRSGATISIGSNLGIKKEKAAEFSFILSIPAVFGANLLQFFSHSQAVDQNIMFYLAGFTSAFFAGYIAIDLVLRFLKKGKFIFFSWYAVALGLLVIIFS